MKTVIVILDDREILENIEGTIFKDDKELIYTLKSLGMDDKSEESLGYYLIADFTQLVNDQVLDDLSGSFICYVNICENE